MLPEKSADFHHLYFRLARSHTRELPTKIRSVLPINTLLRRRLTYGKCSAIARTQIPALSPKINDRHLILAPIPEHLADFPHGALICAEYLSEPSVKLNIIIRCIRIARLTCSKAVNNIPQRRATRPP